MSVYVATHKTAPMPRADWLVPIGLGGFRDADVTVADADGDNIAAKNRMYCELTGTWWLWKHCDDPFVGLCHYRRMFAFEPLPVADLAAQPIVRAPADAGVLGWLGSAAQRERLDALLGCYDIVLPRPVAQQPSIAASFRAAHGDEAWAPFVDACRDEFGDVADALELETRFHWANMLVARREVFRDYAQTLFRVVDRVVDAVGEPAEVPGARYQPYRYPGYLGERFTSLYVLARRLRPATVQTVWLA